MGALIETGGHMGWWSRTRKTKVGWIRIHYKPFDRLLDYVHGRIDHDVNTRFWEHFGPICRNIRESIVASAHGEVQSRLYLRELGQRQITLGPYRIENGLAEVVAKEVMKWTRQHDINTKLVWLNIDPAEDSEGLHRSFNLEISWQF